MDAESGCSGSQGVDGQQARDWGIDGSSVRPVAAIAAERFTLCAFAPAIAGAIGGGGSPSTARRRDAKTSDAAKVNFAAGPMRAWEGRAKYAKDSRRQ